MTKIKPFQAIKPNLDLITSPDVFFAEVKKSYPEFNKGGFFSRMGSEGIYIYRLRSKSSAKIGIVARMPVENYENGHVIKHEHTLAAKEQKMMLLTLERDAMVKPILLTYPEVPEITKLIRKHLQGKKPDYTIHFEQEGTIHEFFSINSGEDILKYQQLFEQKVPKTYVADGHHRLATASLLKKRMKGQSDNYNYFLTAIFSTTDLEIHDYNRIVEFDNFSPMVLMALLSRKFNISILEKPRKPKKKHEITMTLGQDWFSLKWRAKVLKKYESTIDLLDVNLLNEEIFAHIFDVEDISTDKRVKYIEGPKGIEGILEKASTAENKAIFVLPRVTWDEFLDITNSGATLPPKSTWFEPRMKNGVITYSF